MIGAIKDWLGRIGGRKESGDLNLGKYIRIGKAYSFKNREIGWLYWERPQRQMIVFGASGSGKSEFLTRLMYEDIVNGAQSFNIDPKGSKSWLEAFFKACEKIGKLYDPEGGPVVLALNHPEVSFRFNPLYGLEPHQIASIITAGVPDSKEPFWRNITFEIVLAIALSLKAKGMEQICFGDIYEYLNVDRIKGLQVKITKIYARNPTELGAQALTILDKIGSYDPQYFPRVNSTLRTYLTRLITGKTGYLLNVKVKKDILRERIKNGQLRFFAFLNAEKEGQTAYDVARLLFAWLLAVVGEYSKEFTTIEPQLRVNVDEATEVGFWEVNKAIRLVRERNVAIKLFTQSPSGFKSAFQQNGENIVNDIINNCDCRVVFAINEPEDQRYFTEMSGTMRKPKAIVHKQDIALTYTEGNILEPQDFTELKAGWGYCFVDGDVYLIYSPLLSDRRSVKILWGNESEGEKGDVVVDLKKVFNLVIEMRKIRTHYTVELKQEDFKNEILKKFYEEFNPFFDYYDDAFRGVVRWMDILGGIPSTRGKNPSKFISLVEHSVNVARNMLKEVLGKSEKEMPQKKKEIMVLASLCHDLGKAVAEYEGYEMKDHVHSSEFKETLSDLGVPEEAIEIAIRHHDRTDDPMVKLLQQVDRQARAEERESLEPVISQEFEKLDTEKLFDKIMSIANDNPEYHVFTLKNKVYISASYLRKEIGEKLNILPSEEDIEKFLGMEMKMVQIYRGKDIAKPWSKYLVSEYDIRKYPGLEEKKRSSTYFKGFRIEERSLEERTKIENNGDGANSGSN